MKITQTPVPGYQGTGRAQGTAAHPPSMFSSALETARNTVDHSPVLLGTITRRPRPCPSFFLKKA